MKITALIVTYNRIEKLKKTIEATLALPFCSIVLVDNASTDHTDEWLKTISDDRLTIIRNKDNVGGAQGFKLGAHYINNNIECEWVLFFDDDAYPQSDFFEEFYKGSEPECGIYASKVINIDSELCKMNVPWKVIPKGVLGNIDYMFNKRKYVPNYGNAEYIKSFSFVGLIIKKNILMDNIEDIVGDLFIYYDDVYFSYALHKKNYLIKLLPEVIMIHDVKNDNLSLAPWKYYFLVRNIILSLHLFKGNSPFGYGGVFLRVLNILFFSLRNNRKNDVLRKIFNGIKDGIVNKSGKGINW